MSDEIPLPLPRPEHVPGLVRLAETLQDALAPGWAAVAFVLPPGGPPQLLTNLPPDGIEAVVRDTLKGAGMRPDAGFA